MPTLSPYPGQVAQALQFIELSSANPSDYAVAWNETVTNASGNTVLGDQVEFALFKAGTGGGLVTQSEFQILDGEAQNIRINEFADPFTAGQEDIVLAYGDDTGTHINEYGVKTSGATTTVTPLASFTDPTAQAFDNLTILGDGRIAITYDDLVNPSPDETSQYDFKIFDLRSQGLNNPTLSTIQANYVAGTHFSDTVTGATGVNNFYYYVGADTTIGSGPSDTFNGGTGGWNVAVFADGMPDYSVVAQSGGYLITENLDAAHSGTLTVNGNVEALAFAPTQDPSPASDGSLTATGSGLAILQSTSKNATIDAGATLALFAPDTGTVTFAAARGIAQFDQPTEFNGTISGSGPGGTLASGDILQLIGYDSSTTATPGTFNGTTTTLTVTDPGHTTLSLTLIGNYSGSTFTVTPVSGGVDIVDPPGTAATIANGATLDINAPSSETVTFTGGTGSLVLDQPNTFSGQISGFTGTAPDAAQSDTIELVGINYNSAQFSETYNTSSGVLKVTDGSTSASLTFDNFNATFDFASDGNGGTLIYDPAANAKVDTGSQVVADGSHQVPPLAVDQGTSGGVHDIVAPASDAAGSAASLAASTHNAQGLSLDSDQNGLSTTASFLGNDRDRAIDPWETDQNVSTTHPAVFGADHVIVPAVLGAGQAIIAPVPDAAGSAASFASTHNDQGLSLDSDQNGLSTTASFLGNDRAIDPSGTVQNVSATDPAVFGADHVIVPAVIAPVIGGDQVIGLSYHRSNSSGLGDHAIAQPVTPTDSPDNAFVLGADHVIVPAINAPVIGGDQVIVQPLQSSGLGDHAIAPPVTPTGSPDNAFVLGAKVVDPSVTDAAGSASSSPFASSTNIDHGLSLDSDKNGLSTTASFLGTTTPSVCQVKHRRSHPQRLAGLAMIVSSFRQTWAPRRTKNPTFTRATSGTATVKAARKRRRPTPVRLPRSCSIQLTMTSQI